MKMKKKHKLCVVGAGRWGLNHIRTLHELGHLGGVIDVNDISLNEIKLKYPECSVFSNLDSSFSSNFDGYIVSTPPSTHFKIAKKIINNSKHVLVEKPLTLNLKDAISLNELAKSKNVNLMVGHLLLFHPAFKKIKKFIDDGLLGMIQYIYSNRLNLGSFRNDENVLWSFAPHDIALFNHFFQDMPLKIVSNGIDILQNGIHDTSITSFQYEGKRMGHIFVSWLHPFKEHRFVIVGSKGMIHFEDSGSKKPLLFYDKTVDTKGELPKPKLGDCYEIKYNDEMPLTLELKYFISKINKGKIEVANGDSAVSVMRVLEKATNSLKSIKDNV
jgi:UDP-2-acetamido-3-amino-2,3-dideoxy-glucuronate N-acetyltransferase